MWPATACSCKVPDIFCLILNKFGFSRQLFVEVPTGSRADIPGQTDEHDGANRCFMQLRHIALRVNLFRNLKSLC